MNATIEFLSDLSPEDKNIIKEGLLIHGAEEGGLPIESIRAKPYYFVVRRGGVIKAGLIASIRYHSAFIDMLWVDKNLRRQGIGRELLKKAESYAINQCCTVIFLNTLSSANISFYIKNGYILEFTRANYIQSFSMMYFNKKLN